jgi:hypothetical protein
MGGGGEYDLDTEWVKDILPAPRASTLVHTACTFGVAAFPAHAPSQGESVRTNTVKKVNDFPVL